MLKMVHWKNPLRTRQPTMNHSRAPYHARRTLHPGVQQWGCRFQQVFGQRLVEMALPGGFSSERSGSRCAHKDRAQAGQHEEERCSRNQHWSIDPRDKRDLADSPLPLDCRLSTDRDVRLACDNKLDDAALVLFQNVPGHTDAALVLFWVIVVLQRDFTSPTELGDSSLPMSDMRRLVAPLPVVDQVQRHLGIKFPLGQDSEQQHLHLGQGQVRRFS